MIASEIQPQLFHFKDDGTIPNNMFPAIIYRRAFLSGLSASKMISHFASNHWTNSWDNGVYAFDHYHSNTHEVLGVYAGSATLQLGGEQGEKAEVEAGDIIIIPAGVGHKNLGATRDFGVVGAYPDGRDPDLLKGEKGERPKADKTIATLPVPVFDPLLGKANGLVKLWKK